MLHKSSQTQKSTRAEILEKGNLIFRAGNTSLITWSECVYKWEGAQRELFWVMKMFCTLIMVVLVWVHTSVKTCRIIHLK